MGVNLGEIVKGKKIEIEEMFDKAIAVDAFNWIYQFLSTIRQKDGEPLKDINGNITSHLSGLFYRNIRMMEAGIRLVYVFDGAAPDFKKEEKERRKDIKEDAKREWKKALREGRHEDAEKYAKRTAEITEEIIEDSKKLLKAMGISCVQAKSEGEALASVMTWNGDAFAIATQDYDSLLFGCKRVIRNLSITGRKKRGNGYVIINPEIIELSKMLKGAKINREQLICIGILIGTDFNVGGVSGYGAKRALELAREKKTKEKIFSSVNWDFDTDWLDIYEFFSNPPVGKYRVEKEKFDEEKIKKLLVDDHDFSEERIDNAIRRIAEAKRTGQKSLQKWISR